MRRIEAISRLAGWAALFSATAAITASPASGQVRSGGDGLVYLATYEPSIHVLTERDLSVVAKIPMASGVPGTIEALSADQRRFYVLTIDYDKIEVVDLERRESIGVFTLSERNERVRIRGLAPHPDGRHLVLLLRRYAKLRDRWQIGESELVLYDMEERRIARDVPWPDGRARDDANFAFSPDGSRLYFFMDVVRIYDTESYTEVDRWDYRNELGSGIGVPSIGFPATYREEPGWYTGLFTVHEEIQDRDLLGVARVNPTLKVVQPTIFGPRETGPRNRVSFSISADRTRAYGLHQEIENYQLWAFDLEQGRARHVEFDGRPRMELEVSSNGELLYIYNAGNTIDVHEAASLEHLGQVALDADMLRPMWILPPPSAGPRR